MEYIFASRRQLSFIVTVGNVNRLVVFGDRNIAGVSVFMTNDEKVARAIRRHSLTRRGIIEETTRDMSGGAKPAISVEMAKAPMKKDVEPDAEKPDEEKPDGDPSGVVAEETDADTTGTVAEPGDGAETEEGTVAEETDADTTGTVAEPGEGTEAAEPGEPKEKVYDNYTVARESICQEFGIKKADVRNPTALARVALEHGIIIKYKEL